MKKYLFGALALPLLFACSAEDLTENKVPSNDKFAGIEKVDATFTLDEGEVTRMATQWGAELNDRLGFAWLTNDYTGTPNVTKITIDGQAYQNHPLFLKPDGINFKFVPETSIYVGKYFVYYPFDETTVDIGKINFKSLEEQPLKDGIGGGNFEAIAKNSINIGDKFTEVTPDGTTVSGKTWDKAGIKASYKLYAAPFSNQTGLDLTYQKNNPTFTAAKRIQGATDIDFTIAAGEEVGAAAIYSGTVQLAGAAKSFTYAPTAEPSSAAHSATYWADKSNVKSVVTNGFTFTSGSIILKAADEENGVTTATANNKGWFWFNSLPVDAGDGTTTNTVDVVLETSYGKVTVKKSYSPVVDYTVGDCAYVFDNYANTTGVFNPNASNEWIKLVSTADNAPKKEWNLAAHKTFINHYGDHKGKFALTVDFSTGDMSTLHIKNDRHLQTVLRYYIATGKSTAYVLNLDKDAAGEFKISKKSIALLQTINRSGLKVTVKPCALDAAHAPSKIVVTQEGTDGKTEVPNLDNVFATPTHVYLSKDCNWTWKERTPAVSNKLTIDANVTAITNEGTLTVNATNIELTNNSVPLNNAAGATMYITKVTTVKDDLTNLGTINVGSASNTGAELRAYDAVITNNAEGTSANEEYGIINNFGVVGKSAGTTGVVNNYGYIYMQNNDAITLLKTNEKASSAANAPFGDTYAAGTNMMGTVVLPNGNPYALVSVNNGDETGFIKYTLPAGTTTYRHDSGNVKYNTIIVSDNITFAGTAGSITEIKYIEFNGNRTQVVNPDTSDKLTSLKGVIINQGKSIILEKNNQLVCSKGAFLGDGATVYLGGTFTYPAGAQNNNYFGTWRLDQIVEY